MTVPNFFILGAPRSATTFLYRAVTQHPQIFMSAVKEPAFFSHDGRDPEWVTPIAAPKKIATWEEYLHLFDDSESYPIRGEASTGYLADDHAAQRIRARLDETPYLVAILRNPADRAYSHYLYHRMLNVEPAETFERALLDEPNRQQHHWNMQWRYRETGLYGEHLKRYLNMFGPDRLLVLLHEDFADVPAVLGRVFTHLGIEADVTTNLEGKVNQSGVSKGSLSSWLLQNRNPIKLIGFHLLPRPMRKRLRNWLTDRPPELSQRTRRSLIEYYLGDMEKAERLINRDLSAWRKA